MSGAPANSAPSTADSKIAEDFQTTKNKLVEVEAKQRKVLSALYHLNLKIKKTVANKGQLSQQRAFLELNIQQLNKKVEELDQSSRMQRTLLAERLKAIYKLGSASIARFLFSSGSSASLERNLKIMGLVATRDFEIIKNYSRDLKDLEYRKKTLAIRLESMKLIEQKITAEEKQLRREQDLKEKILNGVRKSRMFAIEKMNGLREKDSGLLDSVFKPSFADQKGTLKPPLQGLITKKFGLIKGGEHPYAILSKGVFISAAKGSPIKSVFNGSISYAGEIPGYGRTLIVDHGDHYYSVYSNTQQVQVKVGDEVTASQVIAKVGEAPYESNPGLYFEIRHFSEPYDPQQWMKGL